METRHRDKYLLGESYKRDSVNEIVNGSYDLIILTSSWDSRCTSIPTDEKVSIKSEHGIFINLPNRDSKGLRDKHDQIIKQYMNKLLKAQFNELSFEKRENEKNLDLLLNKIFDLYNKKKRPLNILIDISTCPRYYSLATIAVCIKKGILNKFTVFYAEGEYPLPPKRDIRNYEFKEGDWENIVIPFLEGPEDIGKNRYYLVDVGFEGTKTMRAATNYEPDRISIVFPIPGVKKEYERITKKVNKRLKEYYNVPDKQIINATAGDAIEVWKKLDEHHLERDSSESTYYLCCGTKAHSLGLALRAICLGYPSVMYSMPEGYNVTETKPLGIYWKYEIYDLSSPM